MNPRTTKQMQSDREHGIVRRLITDHRDEWHCESCGWPLDKGDWSRWDETHEILTCSLACARAEAATRQTHNK